MPSILIEYRLRIRNAADNADVFEANTVRGNATPWLVGPPTGDGSSIDPLSGKNVAGSFTCQVADFITGGTARALTSILEDGTNRQQLGDRKAFVEFRENGGAWQTLIAGFVTQYQLSNDATWDVTVSDPFRVEHEYTAFAPQVSGGTLETISAFLSRWPNRGCIFGGPIRGTGNPGEVVFLGQKNLGGFEVQAAARTTVASGQGSVWLKFLAGYGPPGFGRTTRARDVSDLINAITTPMLAAGYYYPTNGVTTFAEIETPQDFPGVVLELVGVGFYVVITPAGASRPVSDYPGDRYRQFMQGDMGHQGFFIQDTSTLTIGSTVLRARAFTARVSEVSPIYWSGHPVDLLKNLWIEAGVPYNATAIETVRGKIGADRRLSLRITAPQPLASFLEETIYGPFGIGVRTDSSGQAEAISTRVFVNAPPSATLADADVIQGETRAFSLNASGAVRKVVLEHEFLQLAQEATGEERLAVSDGIVSQPYTIERTNGDPGAIGHGEQRYKIPGMIHRAGSNSGDTQGWFDTVAKEIFDRYGRGVQEAETAAIRGGASDGAGFGLGDEILVNLKQLPNHNKRLGDDGSVGARAMQIVHLTPTLRGKELGLVDSGPNAQPLATVPTLTIAASGDFPLTLATVTITNAATLNAAGYGLRLQMATTTGGAPAATDYVDVYVAQPGTIPTTAIRLPVVLAGRTVYARARSELATARPSNWSSGANVTLSSLGAPSAVSVTPDGSDGSKATVTWTIGTNGADAETDVYLRASGAGASAAVRIQVLPPGSTRALLEHLTPSSAYTVGIQHRIKATGDVSSTTESTFTAGATTVTLSAPILPTGYVGSIDLFTGVPQRDDLFGLAVLATVVPSFVEFEVAVETSVGSGTYGSFALADTVASVQGNWTLFAGHAPNDGLRRQIRARHVRTGATSSSYCATVTVTPWEPLALPPSSQYDQCTTNVVTADATTVTVAAHSERGGQVRLVAVDHNGAATSGAALNTLTGSGAQWTFPRNAFQAGDGSATFEAVTSGYVTDPDVIVISEQGRDTVPLSCRLEVLGSSDATHIDVRVTAVDPLGTATGIAVGVVSNQGVSAPSTINGTSSPVNSGGFVEWRITRPSPGSATGRVLFSVSVSGRVTDYDAQDVPAADVIVPTLDLAPTISATQYSIAFTSTGTVEHKIDAGSYGASSSPVVVGRNAAGGADKVVTFRATLNGQIVYNSVTVPAQVAPVYTISNIVLTRDSGSQFTVSWDTDAPGGSTFRIQWLVIESGATGTVDGATSPQAISATLTATPHGRAVITAFDSSGNQIAQRQNTVTTMVT